MRKVLAVLVAGAVLSGVAAYAAMARPAEAAPSGEARRAG